MLIGEDLHYSQVMERLLPMEEQLGRPINPTLYSLHDWAARLAAGNSFVVRVLQQDKINLIGATLGVHGWTAITTWRICSVAVP